MVEDWLEISVVGRTYTTATIIGNTDVKYFCPIASSGIRQSRPFDRPSPNLLGVKIAHVEKGIAKLP